VDLGRAGPWQISAAPVEVARAARPEIGRVGGPAQKSPVLARMELGQHEGGWSVAGRGSLAAGRGTPTVGRGSPAAGGWPEAEKVAVGGDI
jgi:hypothetical protein